MIVKIRKTEIYIYSLLIFFACIVLSSTFKIDEAGM